MPFKKGDKRPPNAGRKPGSRNRRTVELEWTAALTGKTPLKIMLATMHHYEALGEFDKAAAVARDAAPYIHPRMASIAVGGQPGGHPIETREVSNVELARRIAFIFGQAAREQAEEGGNPSHENWVANLR
jgi:hypothetical protein